MRLMLRFATLIAALSNIAAIAATQPAANPDGIYTQDKPYVMVSADKPQFTLKLEANPTTGYSWYLHQYDANLLQPVKHQYVAPKTTLVGAPGYDLWTFKMKPTAFTVPQQTMIHMIYARPWQQNDNPTQVVFYVSSQAK